MKLLRASLGIGYERNLNDKLFDPDSEYITQLIEIPVVESVDTSEYDDKIASIEKNLKTKRMDKERAELAEQKLENRVTKLREAVRRAQDDLENADPAFKKQEEDLLAAKERTLTEQEAALESVVAELNLTNIRIETLNTELRDCKADRRKVRKDADQAGATNRQLRADASRLLKIFAEQIRTSMIEKEYFIGQLRCGKVINWDSFESAALNKVPTTPNASSTSTATPLTDRIKGVETPKQGTGLKPGCKRSLPEKEGAGRAKKQLRMDECSVTLDAPVVVAADDDDEDDESTSLPPNESSV